MSDYENKHVKTGEQYLKEGPTTKAPSSAQELQTNSILIIYSIIITVLLATLTLLRNFRSKIVEYSLVSDHPTGSRE
jgi:hypothetical protein